MIAVWVSDSVKNEFKRRGESVLKLLEKYDVRYEEVGVFGSYAREDYTARSDLDFCIITDCKPANSGSLREEAELVGADIIFLHKRSVFEWRFEIQYQFKKRL